MAVRRSGPCQSVDLTGQLLNLTLPSVISIGTDLPRRQIKRSLVQRQVRLDDNQVERLLAEHAAGATARELATSFGINQSTVYAHLGRHEAPRRVYRKLHGEPLERAKILYVADGLSLRAVARALSISRDALRAGLAAAGVEIR